MILSSLNACVYFAPLYHIHVYYYCYELPKQKRKVAGRRKKGAEKKENNCYKWYVIWWSNNFFHIILFFPAPLFDFNSKQGNGRRKNTEKEEEEGKEKGSKVLIKFQLNCKNVARTLALGIITLSGRLHDYNLCANNLYTSCHRLPTRFPFILNKRAFYWNGHKIVVRCSFAQKIKANRIFSVSLCLFHTLYTYITCCCCWVLLGHCIALLQSIWPLS